MASTASAWLQPPRLRTLDEEDDERHATWFELFFDLVLVAAVSQLAAALSREPTVDGFLRFAGLFVPIGWAWAGFTFYANRFGTDDVIYRLVKALAMLAITALAVSVHSVMRGGHGSVTFALSFVATRICLLALYARARRHVSGPGRGLIDIYLAGFSAGAAVWLISIAVPGPARYWMWAGALAFELMLPALAWRLLGSAAVNASHITERYGQFFIIVLGEAVVAVVAGIAGTHLGAAAFALATCGLAIGLCLWWIYFDLADTSVVGRGLLGLVFVYAHFLLLAGVAAVGAGIKIAITHANAPSLGAGARWAICGGLALYLLSLALLHIAAEWTSLRDRAFIGRLVSAAVVIVLAAAGGGLAPVAFAAILAAMLIAQLALELATYPLGASSVWVPATTPLEAPRPVAP
ncbi:MAG TPA: low temperature requirement protein A [Solirubrobacteraceae bacterium]|jgi:low temperature requirement protein LtrA|nr:low temperature requirement protein A [Solirubrobacteraceae bacterium]